MTVCRGVFSVRNQGVKTGNPVQAVLVQHVASDESAAADGAGNQVVAAELVIEVRSRTAPQPR